MEFCAKVLSMEFCGKKSIPLEMAEPGDFLLQLFELKK